jgi:hypothetical protein
MIQGCSFSFDTADSDRSVYIYSRVLFIWIVVFYIQVRVIFGFLRKGQTKYYYVVIKQAKTMVGRRMEQHQWQMQ